MLRNNTPGTADVAYRHLLEVLPASEITYTVNGGDIDLCAYLGASACSLSISGAWRNGRFVHGRVGDRSISMVSRFLDAVASAVEGR